MKVAIVHDYIKEYGGAEKVLEELINIWPKAHVYTTIFSPSYLGPHKARFKKFNIHTSFLQYIPFKEKMISLARFIGPLIFRSFDLSAFDLIIVSQAGTYVSPNLIKKGKAKVITYCHTPPRWLYGYPTAGGWEKGTKKAIKKFLGTLPIHILRMLDYEAAQLPDYYLANSKEVAGRIEKFYRRKSHVVYPPVEVMGEAKKTGNYYLAGGRLARPKRIDLAVRACNRLGLSLKVFGKEFSGYGSELRKIAGTSVEFLGEIDDERKSKLMQGAKAFIFPAEEEDFGITPVEAMGAGTPVIAYRSGGVQESVVEGKTGVFFEEATVESLVGVLKKFDKSGHLELKSSECVSQARKFSSDRFRKEIKDFVSSKVKKVKSVGK